MCFKAGNLWKSCKIKTVRASRKLSMKHSLLANPLRYRRTRTKSSWMKLFREDSQHWALMNSSIKLLKQKCGSISLIKALIFLQTFWTTCNISITEHAIKQGAPIEVTKENESSIRERMYGKKVISKSSAKFKVGDKVQINKTRQTFDKIYLKHLTEKIFALTEFIGTKLPPYKLEDYGKEKNWL